MHRDCWIFPKLHYLDAHRCKRLTHTARAFTADAAIPTLRACHVCSDVVAFMCLSHAWRPPGGGYIACHNHHFVAWHSFALPAPFHRQKIIKSWRRLLCIEPLLPEAVPRFSDPLLPEKLAYLYFLQFMCLPGWLCPGGTCSADQWNNSLPFSHEASPDGRPSFRSLSCRWVWPAFPWERESLPSLSVYLLQLCPAMHRRPPDCLHGSRGFPCGYMLNPYSKSTNFLRSCSLDGRKGLPWHMTLEEKEGRLPRFYFCL